MYQFSYAEALEDDQTAARRLEAQVLGRAAELLQIAAAAPRGSRAGIEALHFTRQLWMSLVNELVAPDNALPAELKASLVSIGIWILKEAEAIRLGASQNYAGIADICGIIRDGLR